MNDVQLDWKKNKENRLCDKTECLEGGQASAGLEQTSHGAGDPVSFISAKCWLHPKGGAPSCWPDGCQQKLGPSASAQENLTQAASPLGTNGIALECHVLLGLGIMGLSPGSRDAATFP